MKQDLQIQAIIRQIVQALVDNGLSKENAGKIILELDNEIYHDLSSKVITEMNDQQLQGIDEKVALDQLEKLHMNSEAVYAYYIQRLETYLANLPQHLPEIKQRYFPS